MPEGARSASAGTRYENLTPRYGQLKRSASQIASVDKRPAKDGANWLTYRMWSSKGIFYLTDDGRRALNDSAAQQSPDNHPASCHFDSEAVVQQQLLKREAT
jgi:hypothetical protein